MRFKEFFEEKALEEGFFDTVKQYGKQAAIAGSLMGAGYAMRGEPQNVQNAPPAASVNVSQNTPVKIQKKGSYRSAFDRIRANSDRLRQKVQQLGDRSHGTFVNGQLQDDKEIEDSSVTSPDAAEYFR